MEVKFSKGKWISEKISSRKKWERKFIIHANNKCKSCGNIDNYFVCESLESSVGLETAKANADLIKSSPEMFYQIVLLAKELGYRKLFEIIEQVMGKKYEHGTDEFNNLVDEILNYLKS